MDTVCFPLKSIALSSSAAPHKQQAKQQIEVQFLLSGIYYISSNAFLFLSRFSQATCPSPSAKNETAHNLNSISSTSAHLSPYEPTARHE
jgi:hypothetical protein